MEYSALVSEWSVTRKRLVIGITVLYVCQARVIQTTEGVTISVCTRQPVSRYHACVHSVIYGGQAAHVEPVSYVPRFYLYARVSECVISALRRFDNFSVPWQRQNT